jgi:hypothetical protein
MAVFQNSFVILCLSMQCASALTVDEAYRAIPHNRTVFDVKAGKMDMSIAKDLLRIFEHVDEAIVLRVETMKSRSGRQVLPKYQNLISKMESETIAKSLQPILALIVGAIRDQSEVFAKSEGQSANFSDPHVRSASQKLHSAYQSLMQTFPSEGSVNKQAFFDYLCALDFL